MLVVYGCISMRHSTSRGVQRHIGQPIELAPASRRSRHCLPSSASGHESPSVDSRKLPSQETLLTRRLQRHVPGQSGDTLQPSAHPRVGFEVEATLLGNGRVNVEGNVGHCGEISDEELTLA